VLEFGRLHVNISILRIGLVFQVGQNHRGHGSKGIFLKYFALNVI